MLYHLYVIRLVCFLRFSAISLNCSNSFTSLSQNHSAISGYSSNVVSAPSSLCSSPYSSSLWTSSKAARCGKSFGMKKLQGVEVVEPRRDFVRCERGHSPKRGCSEPFETTVRLSLYRSKIVPILRHVRSSEILVRRRLLLGTSRFPAQHAKGMTIDSETSARPLRQFTYDTPTVRLQEGPTRQRKHHLPM